MNATALAILAATWGVVMAVSPVLQIRKIVRRRSSLDVSIGYLVVLVVGFSLWIAYGIAIRNAALIVPNVVALLVGAWTIGVAVRYRTRGRRVDPAQERSAPAATEGGASPLQ